MYKALVRYTLIWFVVALAILSIPALCGCHTSTKGNSNLEFYYSTTVGFRQTAPPEGAELKVEALKDEPTPAESD